MMSDDRENTGPWLARSKSIMVSGGFDPIHPGHVRLIESAAKLGDVIVALNSDAWLERKKGFCFQGWDERAEVLMAMRNVSKVVPVNDADGTVCAALREYSPDYFANGGDRNTVNTPELSLCAELNIQPLFGIGGDIKKYSSSLIAPRRIVHRPWGDYATVLEGDGYAIKIMSIKPRSRLSMQRHKYRQEHWTVLSGRADVWIDLNSYSNIVLSPGHSINIDPGEWHRLANLDETQTLEVLEIQRGDILDESDIERIADDYGRVVEVWK